MSEQDDASIATSLAYISSSHSPMKGEEVRAVEAVQEEQEKNVGGFAENDLRRALDWMQRDVEQRARENRAVRETLARAIHDITGVIADCVDSEAAKLLLHAATVATGTEAGVGNNAGVIELLPDKVDDLVNQWEDALQKLELLESRMQDVLQQVACDHEQFEYEQVKWALEKRQRREKYDEVLDASVKVLKVLIIREKLMKKHERTQQRGREEIQEQQLNLARQVASLQGMTKELMQECAMTCVATSSGSGNSTVCSMECGEFQECQIYAPDGSEYCADVCIEGRCPKGVTCELQEVQCIRAPCPPVAVCNNEATAQGN
ncbi:hypothetical protein BBO99_00005822 [Phytophthora kernoviae]|uniref:Uncharacterized protein n=2 Tax=Phytophthora kernoviae TaxID=325452 RepID=A0A3R7K578_9STRA|nr:hypothetical protein G195_006733 [Phytophthora kernoviae 00238/432]KAG2522479.1 hypothetical protein JM16_005646 [Phytophthora kernoviae]KAG2524101.1 hypothetical protein JM18_005514 [Phytophthora kernoviae]RLN20436.1 hypothetical protein BBI17_005384 [Phytophthora kernoviae]RLN78641.1 hypothetical protein BBO99_00005822 [Phytophthora kernoviae]